MKVGALKQRDRKGRIDRMRKYYLTGSRVKIEEWTKKAIHLSRAELESARKIRTWGKEWTAFPDSGKFQDTGLTSKISKGACSAIWLKLKPGEGFDPHRHPNASHIMIVYKGEADVFWRNTRNGKIYSATMKVGDKPYAFTPSEQHAIVANRGVEAIILVINSPAEDIKKHNYAVPIRKK